LSQSHHNLAVDSARWSCRRELISSLVNTLRRCHSTVRGLRNSWAAISGLERPARARRAIWASWGWTRRVLRRCAGGRSRAWGVRWRLIAVQRLRCRGRRAVL